MGHPLWEMAILGISTLTDIIQNQAKKTCQKPLLEHLEPELLFKMATLLHK